MNALGCEPCKNQASENVLGWWNEVGVKVRNLKPAFQAGALSVED